MLDQPSCQALEIEKFMQAITVLEAQRIVLGDAVVELALTPLKEKLAALNHPHLAAPKTGAATAQRRIITVLFADVQNFTALSEKMDMEEVRDTMQGVWERVDGLVLKHGGQVDKHMGDSVMAVWGRNAIREDDPEQAIRAAFDIHAYLLERAASNSGAHPQDMPIQMRIGLHTGLAMVDDAVGKDATVLGDTVNLAARLEKAAPPGGILISHETYRHVRGLFVVEAQAPIQLRGKSEPVQTYRVLEPKPLTFRMETRGVEGVETPLVGRQSELQTLQQAFQALQVGPGTRVINVVGDAGIGKSRLVNEFLAWADLDSGEARIFQGRASASMTNSPYSYLREILSLRFQIHDGDSLAEAHAKFEGGLREFLGSDPRSEEKAHQVGHLIGLDYSTSPDVQAVLKDPGQFQRQAITYLAQFFSAFARKIPVLMVFDDLHWADSASLVALKTVLETLSAETLGTPDGPALLALSTARPVLFERYDWTVGTRMDLSPLSRDNSLELVSQILRYIAAPPAILQEMVVSRAEGNPFYLEELIKMLIDTRVIVICRDEAGGPEWRVESDRLVKMCVPATLVEVLQARLDELQPAELLALQRAAVVGRIFWDDAVAYLADETDTRGLAKSLAILESKELIFPIQLPLSASRREYSFKHAILHEVTYETVLKRQRTVYHARAAQWLENSSTAHSAQTLPQIAAHYEKAGQLEQAANVLLKAGRRSMQLGAYSDARGLMERGLGLTETLPESRERAALAAELHVNLSNVFAQMCDYPAAQAQAEATMTLARQYGLDGMVAEAMANLGFIFTDQGEYDRAEACLAEALPLIQAVQPSDLPAGESSSTESGLHTHCFVLSSLAYVNARRANWAKAEFYYSACRDLARQINDTERYLVAVNGLGIAARSRGDRETCRQSWSEVIAVGLESGYRLAALSALNNLGGLCNEENNIPDAIHYYERALKLAIESEVPLRVALLHANLGEANLKLNDLPACRQHLHSAMEISIHANAMPIVLGTVVFFSRLAYAENQVERALELLGAVQVHPAVDADTNYEIEAVIREWKLDEQSAASLSAGAKLDWDGLIRELMEL